MFHCKKRQRVLAPDPLFWLGFYVCREKKFYAESFKGEMWDKISFKISHLRLSLYILDPFCCFIALATVVEKNLSRAFVWTFMVITIQAPKSTIGSFSFCLIGEFRASSNPCSEFLLTTKLRSNVFFGILYGRFLAAPLRQPALLWSL